MPLRRVPLVLLTVASLLGACARVGPGAAPTLTPSPTPTSPHTSTPAPTTTAVPTALVTCTDLGGALERLELEFPGDERPLSYMLYLPPCYDPDRESAYPTLYLLHGLTQSELQWVDLGVAEAADKLITQGRIPAFIIVMPGERTGFDMLSLVADTLLPRIEQSFWTGGDSGLRAIGGLSRGAGWALRIGLQRPDLFGTIGLHSPAVISPDLYDLPTWAAKVPRGAIPRLWIDIGVEDTLLPAALQLRRRLDELRWPYTWSVDRGEHTSSYWSAHLDQYLRWYAEAWPEEHSIVTPGEA